MQTSSDAELARRIEQVGRVFDIDAVLQRDYENPNTTRAYYRATRLAYRHVHDRDGFMHMRISRDGTDKREDILAQPDLVAKYLKDGASVLELATGNGAALKYLARRFPRARFTGLDLSARAAAKKVRGLSNVKILEGDYHDLQTQGAEEHDLAFIVEALCYSQRKEDFFAEIHRILKPGGKLVIADGYRGKDTLTPIEERASLLLERGMAVGGTSETYPAVKAKAERTGLTTIFQEDVSQGIRPSADRLAMWSGRFLAHERLARTATRVLPRNLKLLPQNAISGHLIPAALDAKMYSYWLTVMQKPGPGRQKSVQARPT